MSEIDWSKAPEDATHCWPTVVEFYKLDGAVWRVWYMGAQKWEDAYLFDRIKELIPRPSPAWSGEGLPPVGTVCEISFDGGPLGKALITYRAGNLLCWKWEAQKGEDECCSYVHRLAFKPIRTPEQIAADEREAAIRAIVYDLQDAESLSSLPSIANCLYGKGYRKP